MLGLMLKQQCICFKANTFTHKKSCTVMSPYPTVSLELKE